MAKRKPFYLYQRKKKTGSYWYVCFINPVTGVQENAKSIDVLKEKLDLGSGYAVKDRDSAAIIAGKALESGLVFSQSSSMGFNDYCLSFWDYEKSSYVAMRNSIKPGSIGKEYCMNMLSNYRNHVQPVIPDRIKLANVSVDLLDKVVSTSLSSGLATGSVQMVVLSFSLPLKEAVRRRLIKSNPADSLIRIPRCEKERGILSYDEVRKLVSLMGMKSDDDPLCLAVKLSLTTGMRSGEVRALTRDKITLSSCQREDGVGLARILISSSIAPYTGVKGTKNMKDREVLVDNAFASSLLAIAREDGIIFPMNAVRLRSGFYSLLSEIGISDSERKERNITFHSLRHVFNTLLCDQDISLEERMLALGHSSKAVNDRYLHTSERQLVEVSRVASSILSLSMPGAEKGAVASELSSV